MVEGLPIALAAQLIQAYWCLQEGLHEPQPQALPYAAAVADPDIAFNDATVDPGIGNGLATAAATEHADVAYSQPGQSVQTDSNDVSPDQQAAAASLTADQTAPGKSHAAEAATAAQVRECRPGY